MNRIISVNNYKKIRSCNKTDFENVEMPSVFNANNEFINPLICIDNF